MNLSSARAALFFSMLHICEAVSLYLYLCICISSCISICSCICAACIRIRCLRFFFLIRLTSFYLRTCVRAKLAAFPLHIFLLFHLLFLLFRPPIWQFNFLPQASLSIDSEWFFVMSPKLIFAFPFLSFSFFCSFFIFFRFEAETSLCCLCCCQIHYTLLNLIRINAITHTHHTSTRICEILLPFAFHLLLTAFSILDSRFVILRFAIKIWEPWID